jgi:hypothetical protein
MYCHAAFLPVLEPVCEGTGVCIGSFIYAHSFEEGEAEEDGNTAASETGCIVFHTGTVPVGPGPTQTVWLLARL